MKAIEVFGGGAVVPSYMEWLIADYTKRFRSQTFVEEVLQDADLSAAERTIYESRRDARLSLYRLEASDAPGALEVVDVLTHERVKIHDESLSGLNLGNPCVFLRLFPVENVILPQIAGPVIPSHEIERVLEELRKLGARLQPGDFRPDARWIGRLWQPLAESQGVALQTTEGDVFEPQVALFDVDDPQAVSEQLAARGDLDEVEPNQWVWIDGANHDLSMVGARVLGHLELIENELVLQVHSSARIDRARVWLEKLSGVRFVRSEARPLNLEDIPLDDRLEDPEEGPVPPEVVAQIVPLMKRQLLGWMDEPVPALGGKTPRASCRTKAGRAQVARMIRTMPNPVSQTEIADQLNFDAIRSGMLRELGIDDA